MPLSDHFRINEFKNKIDSLENENHQLQDTITELSKKLDFKLSLIQMEPLKLDEIITTKKAQISELDTEISQLQHRSNDLTGVLTDLSKEKNDLQAEIGDLENDVEMNSYGLYEPYYDFSNVLQYKDELKDIRDQQKLTIKNKQAVSINPNWLVNNSKTEGNKMNRNNSKAILRSFNNECTDAIKKITVTNYDRIEQRIKKSFEQHNKMYQVVEIQLSNKYLSLKLKEAHIALEYKLKIEEEKEALREQREKEREERKLQKEIANKQKAVNKEIDHYKKAIEELRAKLETLEGQELLNVQQNIDELSANINSAEKEKKELDYRQDNATAGYVYIISNIGSFGKDVVKIGVTRRLDPMERISELSSASVPFKFDVHALIFSYNAYELENELHHKFENKRINKVNMRKEYFDISINEIEDTLKEYQDLTVNFSKVPEASEYRETLAML